MIREETVIKVAERTDPLLELGITVVNAQTRERTPHNFTGVGEIEFIIKEGKDTPDDDADVVYTLSGSGGVAIVGAATDGRMTVQVLSADLPEGASVRRFRVDAITAGKRTLLAAGPFIIENI